MIKQYRLPADQNDKVEITDDPEAYAAAWTDLAAPLERRFGWEA